MGNVVMIPENLVALSPSYVAASSEASASMAAMNSANESPSKFWRSESNWPTKCASWFLMGDLGYTADAVGIVGHNLTRGDQYRIWIKSTSGVATRYTGVTLDNPTGTVAGLTTNTTSTFADVDNGETLSTAGTAAQPTNAALSWSIGLSFPTPAGIINGTDLQAFWIFAGSTGTWPDPLPYITVDLYESGVFRQSLGRRSIRANQSTGQVMCFPFDAANLSVSSGANIEVKISCVPRSSGPYVEIYSVVLATDRDTRSSDSGWLTYNPFEGSGIDFSPERSGSGNTLFHQFATPGQTAYFVYLHVRSSRSPLSYDETSEIHPVTHNYVQHGCFVVGETWSPTYNIGYGKLVGAIDSSTKQRTYGGQLLGSRRPVRRVISLDLGHLTPAEAHTLFDRVIWRHGGLKPILISLLPDDATQSKHTTIFATLRNAENWINIQPDQGYENNMTMEFEEVL